MALRLRNLARRIVAGQTGVSDGPLTRSLTPTHNGPCGTCGMRDNAGLGDAPWFAPNDVWNYIYGTPDNRCGDGILRCPRCFTADARAAGFPVTWTIET